jgi:excisionase family DNA binding protein
MVPAAEAVNSKNRGAHSALVEAAERLVSVPDAAAFLSVSEVTIRRNLTNKKLRRFKVGGRTLIKVGDLMALVKEIK